MKALSKTEIKILEKIARYNGYSFGPMMMEHRDIPFTSVVEKLIGKELAYGKYGAFPPYRAYITQAGRDALASLDASKKKEAPPPGSTDSPAPLDWQALEEEYGQHG